MYATLVLDDGTIIEGDGFGAEKEVFGEVVFSTTMSGYQEGLTDPSYKGQILMPTYPLIGNYGINPDDYESDRIKVEGFVVRENCDKPYHRTTEMTIEEFLKKEGIPGISEVDTRSLTIKIREHGVMLGAMKVSHDEIDSNELIERSKAQEDYTQRDLVKEVTCQEAMHFPGEGKRVVVLDCGMKTNIRRSLQARGCDVTVVPAFTTAKEILNMDADGVLVSPGPGDPVQAPYVKDTIKDLLGEKPLFGICLGHQILSLVAGAETFKLKFGHRGANQPVKDLATGKVYVTSQNHGFAVDADSLEGTDLEATHINLNDNTVEGMRYKDLPVFSIQFHPEARPGPHDTQYLFDEFMKMMEGN